MSNGERKPLLIVFKPKDQRPDSDSDKTQVVRRALAADAAEETRFFTADDMSRGTAVPSAMPTERVAYDVNRYEAPIVLMRATDEERAALEADDNIDSVEEDQPAWAFQDPVMGALVMEGQPDLAEHETVPAGVSQVQAPKAWTASRAGAIKVGVLDTGIDSEHPDLKANVRGGASFVSDESSTDDFNGHGTHCAGTIAAAMNGSGVVGVAPNAYLYAVKVLNRQGSGSYSTIIAGLDWATNKKKMQIVSMSLGGNVGSKALEMMCQAAWDSGVLVIAAAGNTGPPPGGEGSSVGFPAAYDSVVAVSAIDSANLIAGFSSRGPEVELCAPGVDVLSTVPGGGHGTKSGTSMACPHVAGVAALALGAHRYTDNVTIRRLLAHTADSLGNPGRDDLYGFGRVDAWQAALSASPPPEVPGLP